MINKQNLWFITLFSLILILGIYYISIPKEALTTFYDDVSDNLMTIEVDKSDIIVALKVEAEENILKQMQEAQDILLDNNSTVTEKNEAYDKLQNLNNQKGKTESIEKRIKEKFQIDSCVTIDGNKINITMPTKDQGNKYANEIITEVQSMFETQKYITVKFQN